MTLIILRSVPCSTVEYQKRPNKLLHLKNNWNQKYAQLQQTMRVIFNQNKIAFTIIGFKHQKIVRKSKVKVSVRTYRNFIDSHNKGRIIKAGDYNANAGKVTILGMIKVLGKDLVKDSGLLRRKFSCNGNML